MKINRLNLTAYVLLLFTIVTALTACSQSGKTQQRSTDANADTVKQMTANISRDLAAKGPIAWLDYFDNSPQFFMINDGQLAFHDYASAKSFIQDTLIKNMHRIALKWKDMRIDPLDDNVVAIGSSFHEDITMVNGQTLPFDGYFSGTAINTPNGWKLINLHWSTPKTVLK
jgi:hypothetical protein